MADNENPRRKEAGGTVGAPVYQDPPEPAHVVGTPAERNPAGADPSIEARTKGAEPPGGTVGAPVYQPAPDPEQVVLPGGEVVEGEDAKDALDGELDGEEPDDSEDES